MIRFRWGPVYSAVLPSTQHEENWLHVALTFRDPNHVYRPSVAHNDGTYRYYEGGYVLTGLVPLVMEIAAKWRIPVVAEGLPLAAKYPSVPRDLLRGVDMDEKYAFQRTLIAQALAAERGLIEVPPRGGKSALFAAIVAMLGEPALILVGERGLMTQLYDAFAGFGLESVGRLGDGHKDVRARTLIAMHQSCSAALERGRPDELAWIFNRGVLIVDEAHLFGGALQWVKVACACPARRRYAFSGTMFQERRTHPILERFDPVDYALVGCFGKPVATVPAEFLRDKDVLVKTYFYMLDVPTERLPDTNNWREIEPPGIVENAARNSMIARLAAGLVRDGRTVLVLVRKIDHGKKLLRMIAALGVEAAFVSGQGSFTLSAHGDFVQTNDRAPVERVRAGSLRCLIGSTVLDQAIDLKTVDALIVGAGIKKATRVAQRAYRPQTAKEGKIDALVFDFADKHQKVLRKHALARLKEYLAQGMTPGVVWPDRWLCAPVPGTCAPAPASAEWRPS